MGMCVSSAFILEWFSGELHFFLCRHRRRTRFVHLRGKLWPFMQMCAHSRTPTSFLLCICLMRFFSPRENFCQKTSSLSRTWERISLFLCFIHSDVNLTFVFMSQSEERLYLTLIPVWKLFFCVETTVFTIGNGWLNWRLSGRNCCNDSKNIKVFKAIRLHNRLERIQFACKYAQ